MMRRWICRRLSDPEQRVEIEAHDFGETWFGEYTTALRIDGRIIRSIVEVPCRHPDCVREARVFGDGEILGAYDLAFAGMKKVEP